METVDGFNQLMPDGSRFKEYSQSLYLYARVSTLTLQVDIESCRPGIGQNLVAQKRLISEGVTQ